MDRRFYVTTPIYYVNGLPHIGHAYTTIAADALTRWHRMNGARTFFLTGTDEHGTKVLESATKLGKSPKEYCDDITVQWKAMWSKLGIRYTRFIRTTDEDHIRGVQAALQKLWNEGLIYKAEYTGWYSVADELFVTEKDITEGRYDRSKLQQITEANYFFKMGAYQERLIAHIEENPSFLRPESRRNEVMGFLRKPLGDLCISRPKARMSWGIPLPFDADYVTYVWFDALMNYLTGVGYDPSNPSDTEWKQWWPVDFHLVGKDILTTHAVYWSTMLMALGVELPQTLFAHGWWTSTDGEKISKSKGNAIDIGLIADQFGVDAARYFFLREIAFGADGGFSYDGFLVRYNADLANDLGNLAHRGLSMTQNWLGGQIPPHETPGDGDAELRAIAARAVASYRENLESLQFHKALDGLWELVRAGNKYVDTQAPWALNKKGDAARLRTVKRHVLEACFVVATLLLPIIPAKASELLRKLGSSEAEAIQALPRLLQTVDFDLLTEGAAIQVGDPLFPRFQQMPDAIRAMFTDPPADKPKTKPEPVAELPPLPEPEGGFIQYDDFAKVKLRVGRVLSAAKHPKADKLLVLQVDIGEARPRNIVAGIASKYAPEDLVGRSVVVVANLAPAKLRGVMSEGMLLAAGGAEVVDLVSVAATPGEVVR
jgi:methionyl-tRNA synthetase